MIRLCIKKKEFSQDDWKSIKRTGSSEYLTHSAYLLKLNSKYKLQPIQSSERSESHQRKIAKIVNKEAYYQFILQKSRLSSSSDYFWLIVNKKSTPSYWLSEGDIIRIFNIYLKIKYLGGFLNSPQINLSTISTQNLSIGGLNSTPYQEAEHTCQSLIIQEEFCRICLESTETDENPFLTPCKCSGSMGYIHYFCLQSWVNSKFHIKDKGFYKIIKWKSIKCESCQEPIPELLHYKSITFSIFSHILPAGKFIGLEVLQKADTSKHELIFLNCENLTKFYLKKNKEFSSNFTKNSQIFVIKNNTLHLSNITKSLTSSVMLNKSLNIQVKTSFKLMNGSTIFTMSSKNSSSVRNFFCFCLKS